MIRLIVQVTEPKEGRDFKCEDYFSKDTVLQEGDQIIPHELIITNPKINNNKISGMAATDGQRYELRILEYTCLSYDLKA